MRFCCVASTSKVSLSDAASAAAAKTKAGISMALELLRLVALLRKELPLLLFKLFRNELEV